MAWLISVSIGPVQEFIATARRSQDLYAASQMLSQLAEEAARFVAHRVGYDHLIFPGAADEAQLKDMAGVGVANIVLAMDPSSEPPDWLEGVEDHLRAYIRQEGLKLLEPYEAFIDLPMALDQIADFPEIYWAAVALKDEHGYADARRRVAALIRARKATRFFTQPSWAGDRPKSSLDGQREHVLKENLRSEDIPLWVRRAWRLRGAENLSGVDLLKRRWGGGRFRSTVDMAVRPYLQKLDADKRERLKSELQALIDRYDLRSDRDDTDREGTRVSLQDEPALYYPSMWDEFLDPKDARKAAEDVQQVYRELKLELPYPYYCILVADGDRMGDALDHVADRGGMAAHQRFSQNLVAFARQVKGVVEAHDGFLVYSGGDDVMAFLPVTRALDCAAELAQLFRETVNFPNPAASEAAPTEEGRETSHSREGSSPTLSVGVAGVHIMEPLQDALELARRALKAAKEKGGRNALAVVSAPRSGSETMVWGSWEGKGQEKNLKERLDEYIRLYENEEITAGLPYELLNLSLRLKTGVTREVLYWEAVRIIRRKDMRRSTQEVLEAYLAPMMAGESQDFLVEQLARELIVARLFSRKSLKGVTR
ncbi:MAG: type III-B CRISPR-associated protein Cas10/Cmr2 [Clostridiales bacterium]|nr:type III-B CRISPR-associated protein Cas10/Cmr2 [Clostridiales bacterium]